MKQICSVLFAITCLVLIGATSVAARTARFAVISDPHFYDTDLGTTGEAFERYLAQDRKMLRESEAILISTLEQIKRRHPEFIIIPGDLTKDGELTSHMRLAGHLADLEASGTKVFVVPGNHDINNPHAVAYNGAETVSEESVTPELFTDIYGAFGYHEAIDRDPHSLSYVVEPVQGVWLLGIDSCLYDNNITQGHPETGGALSDERLAWLLAKLSEAKCRHKTVIGMMHHGVLEHYSGQSQLYADYVIQDWQRISRTLSDAGLQLIFTGHYHANDITQSSSDGDRLYDVETGSLVTYPSPYRMVTLHGNNAATVRTFFIDNIDYNTNGLAFPEYARQFLTEGLTGLAGYQLALPAEQGGFAFSAQEAEALAPAVSNAFIAHYSGDERPDVATLTKIQEYLAFADPRYQNLGQALGTLWTDLPPTDNSAVLTLEPKIHLEPLATYSTGIFDAGAAEISAFDPVSQTLFVVNGEEVSIDMLDISNPALPVAIDHIDVKPYGGGPNSVAVNDGLVAIAVEAAVIQDPGQLVLFTTSGEYVAAYPVGALPDMVTFTPDGRYILVANEGEPNSDYTVDPEGSVSIIDLKKGPLHAKVKTADFRCFNDDKMDLTAQGVRIFGPNATVAQDLEPEYISVAADSSVAWVSLQENNAMALIHIPSGRVKEIMPLGFKDHGQPINGLDASDADSAIHIEPYTNLLGMYQPDAITAYHIKGRTYIVTANEGDSRDYDLFSEEALVKDLVLDPQAFPNAQIWQNGDVLGNLTVTNTLGDSDGDGDFDQLYAFGARSFSIFEASRRGLTLVYDSMDQLEQITAAALPYDFNSDNDENGSFDSRSTAKGPEPEGLAIGRIGCQLYAFICLERVGGVMVYDITHPDAPEFVQYLNNRDFGGDAASGASGDLGPEGIVFIDAQDSPDGQPMLVVANEVSGTTTLYRIEVSGCPLVYAWK